MTSKSSHDDGEQDRWLDFHSLPQRGWEEQLEYLCLVGLVLVSFLGMGLLLWLLGELLRHLRGG